MIYSIESIDNGTNFLLLEILIWVMMMKWPFLHDRQRLSPWIKLISSELGTIYSRDRVTIVTSSAIDCDVISRTKTEQVRRGERCVRIVVLSSFMDWLCRVRNKTTYVLSWRTVALTRVLFLCLSPPLLRNSGDKHKKHLVSAATVRHSSTYIIKSTESGVTLCFQFVSAAASAPVTAKTFASHVKTVSAKP